MIRAVLIDDERLARKYLKQLLAAYPYISVVGEAESVEQGVHLCLQTIPELIFLDIQMPGSDGFALLSRLPQMPKVIFVTAHAEFASRAFDVQAVDYLLKPVAPVRMAQALQRAGALPGEAAALSLDDSVCLRDGSRVVVAPVRDIAMIESEADYTRVHLRERGTMLVFRRMHEWETILPTTQFARLDRTLFINHSMIDSVEADSRDHGLLRLASVPTPITLGRAALARVKQLLKET
jgi:two-component system, LytTR family, response regulator